MNIKFIFLFLLGLFFVYNISFTGNIDIENLSLYKYLKNLDKTEYKDIKFQIDKALNLFSSLHAKLNDNHFFCNSNRKIINMFLDICQDLKNFEQIKIRDLRALRYKVLDFDNYLADYKHIIRIPKLSEQEVQFMADLKAFNKNLLDFLLNSSFLNANFDEKFVDLFFYRPRDFVCRHKLFFGVTTCLAASILGSCIGYKLLNCKDSGHISKYKDFTIQLRATPQSGAECGLHAIKNALIFKLFDNQEDIEKMLKDKDFENYLLKICREYVLQIREEECVRALPKIQERIDVLKAQIETGIFDKKLSKEKKLELKKEQNNKKDLERRRGNTSWLDDGEISRCIDYLSRERSGDNDKDLFDIPAFVLGSSKENNARIFESLNSTDSDRIPRKINFKINGSESIIVRDGGHWFAAKLIKDPDSEKGIKIIVTNSLSGNLKNSESLKQIVDWYLNPEN
ncbi:MAG: hypothetical protein WC436_02105 [Candidatus Babeliales bacterium]